MVDDQQIIESHKVAPSDVKAICRSALTIIEIQKRQQEVSEEIVSLSENLLSYRNLSSLLKKLREEGNLKDADYGSILEKSQYFRKAWKYILRPEPDSLSDRRTQSSSEINCHL